jgi:hypothetical protein
MDQALVIETDEGVEEIHRWSEVSSAGDLILLKPSPPEQVAAPDQYTTPAGPRHCGSCGALLDPGAGFCGSCGKRAA